MAPLSVVCPHCKQDIELDMKAIGKAVAKSLGERTSARKAKSSAENGKKGGRPRKTDKKTMTKTIVLAILLGLSAACSSSPPTAPTPVVETSISATTPAPEPVPTPTPVPTPSPVPPPAPPAPSAVEYYDAEVGTAHWFGAPLFGKSFVIELWRERGELWLHNTRLPIVHQDADSIIARDGQMNVTLVLKSGVWSFNGLAGSGAGTLAMR